MFAKEHQNKQVFSAIISTNQQQLKTTSTLTALMKNQVELNEQNEMSKNNNKYYKKKVSLLYRQG